MGKTLMALGLLTLAGCSVYPTDRPDPALGGAVRLIWCDSNQPRRDATPETPRPVVDEINAHNRKGALWCGWTP